MVDHIATLIANMRTIGARRGRAARGGPMIS